MARPLFRSAWTAFMEVKLSVEEVAKKIGGRVQQNIELPVTKGGFENACSIRISYVLNKTGFPILKSSSYKSVSGADNMQYIYRVGDMMRYLEWKFGRPDKITSSPKVADFKGIRGIILVKGAGWGNAIGHVTLWDGMRCPDSCHLMYDPENASFIPSTGAIWVLP